MTEAGRVEEFPDPAAVADAAASVLAQEARRAITARGRFVVALAGGSTPRSAYARLAGATGIDWTRVHVVWGDERCVPADHDDSNYRMAREALLDHVDIPARQVHRIRGEAPPDAEAARYEADLRALVPDGVLDVVQLGLGADAHTASLFPDDATPHDDGRWVRAVSFADRRGRRITLTAGLLTAARMVVFVVAGREKAPAVVRVLGAQAPVAPLAARDIASRGRNVRWLLDRAAASGLGGLPRVE